MLAHDEVELLETAAAHLRAAGLAVALTVPADGDRHDALFRLGSAEPLFVEVKRRISPATAHFPSTRTWQVLVAPHVSDTVAEILREQGVYYVDSVGNMYLRGPGLLLDVRGRRGPEAPRPGAAGRPMRAFKPGGLKVLFVLLADPGLVAAPYRDIAAACGVSVGTIHWVMKELEDAGYLAIEPRRLYRTRELFDRWVEAYGFELWPRLTLAHFDAPDPGWWKNADDALRAAHAQWGGETAAHRLDPRLRPAQAVIYAAEVPAQLALEYRFRRAGADGNVAIRERFWRLPADPVDTVPSPLVYADLVASADPRLIEAAADLRRNDELLGRLDHG
ncbi:type IV toxin-antitoxin system AbiEi family antitoxin [Actinoplanes sp. CA-030573]|uniref:type IV toxin-antitoxin system AbiEi family antitoxin n=1 Tax=Actinoplanes sp. CA-030573 TaxID=3239898 RepID=UPI003D8DDB87